MATSKTVSIKLVIDSKANQVLFAEAGKDFVDFLFHFLSLPVGTLVQILSTETMVGCLGNLYKSVEKLDSSLMVSAQSKDAILKPKVLNQVRIDPLLPPDVYSSEPEPRKILYICAYCFVYVSDEKIPCPSCKKIIDRERKFVEPPKKELDLGFVKEKVFMVLDDLTVHNSTLVSIFVSLGKVKTLNVEDLCNLEEDNDDASSSLQLKTVDLGIEEGLELLKASMQSKTVLTDVFLKRNPLTTKPDAVLYDNHLI